MCVVPKRAEEGSRNSVAQDLNEKTDLKRILDWMRRADMAVIVSEEAGEEEKFEKNGLDIKLHRKRIKTVDENGHELEDKFKEPTDPLQLVFVCSMWLTGFDAPTVSTLYLDKPMKDHTLMQTIARANRVTDFTINNKPKKNGLVVDYYNVFRNLKKAFASYGGGSIGTGKDENEHSPARDIESLFTLLKEAIAECEIYCKGIGVELNLIAQSTLTFGKLSLFDEFAIIKPALFLMQCSNIKSAAKRALLSSKWLKGSSISK